MIKYAIGAAIIAIGVFAHWYQTRFLRQRRGHRQLWQNAFRPEDYPRIDQLLTDICDAFIIPKKHKYSLKPSDDLMTIYRNVTALSADSMEFEHLSYAIEHHFNISEAQFRDMLKSPVTVGDLAKLIAQPIRKEETPNQAIQPTRLPKRQPRG